MTTPLLLNTGQTGKTMQQDSDNGVILHVLKLLPDPYPPYPILITRVIEVHEARKIDKLYGVSNLPPKGIGYSSDYKTLALRIYHNGEDSLNQEEEAFVQFVNTIYFFCYEKDLDGEMFSLTCKTRRARGTVVCNPNKKVLPISALDDSLVDQALEWALEKRDFQAIRAILNFEGYGVPIKEPNGLVIPETWGIDKSDANEEEVIEIEMTAEEYQLWQEMEDTPPEPITEPSSFVDTPEFKAFAERMAQNVPLQLEHAIRQRDIPTLRMWLRLYGRHNIAAPEPGSALLGARRTQEAEDTPPTLDF